MGRELISTSPKKKKKKCEGRIHKTLGGTSLLTVLVRSECRHQTRLRLMCRDCLPCKAVNDYKRRRLTARRAHGPLRLTCGASLISPQITHCDPTGADRRARLPHCTAHPGAALNHPPRVSSGGGKVRQLNTNKHRKKPPKLDFLDSS